jgi:hypothetical protein
METCQYAELYSVTKVYTVDCLLSVFFMLKSVKLLNGLFQIHSKQGKSNIKILGEEGLSDKHMIYLQRKSIMRLLRNFGVWKTRRKEISQHR